MGCDVLSVGHTLYTPNTEIQRAVQRHRTDTVLLLSYERYGHRNKREHLKQKKTIIRGKVSG